MQIRLLDAFFQYMNNINRYQDVSLDDINIQLVNSVAAQLLDNVAVKSADNINVQLVDNVNPDREIRIGSQPETVSFLWVSAGISRIQRPESSSWESSIT